MAKARKEFNIKYKDKMEEEKAVADKVCRGEARPRGRRVEVARVERWKGRYVDMADQ
jgi:hypothetical protein